MKPPTREPFLIGFHVSIAGDIARAPARAAALGCTTFQIFPSNPRGWRQKELTDGEAAAFREARDELGFDVFFVHLPYLPNLAAPEKDLYDKSVAALTDAMTRTARLGGRYVVAHLGSDKGTGLEEGEERAARALRQALAATPGSGVTVLMENSAGKREPVGSTLPSLNRIYGKLAASEKRRVALCLDTCHAHAMAYDLATAAGLNRLMGDVDKRFGLAKVKLLHLNDAKYASGSGRDRHRHVGKGTIGRGGLRRIINHPALRDVPMVMETPQEEGWDQRNMRAVRRLRERRNLSLTDL